MGDINSNSANYRDELLNYSIGKYNMVKSPMIYPIGGIVDFNQKFKKNQIMTNGLLDYYNNTKEFIKTGEFEENIEASYLELRDLNSTNQFVYQEKYTELYNPTSTYLQKIEDNGLNVILNNLNAIAEGSSFGVDLNSSGKIDILKSYDFQNDNIVTRSVKVASGTETKLGNIGLRSLGFALLNSALINNERKISTLSFLQKPLDLLNDIDKLDTEKLKIPEWLTNGVTSVFPIYLYSEVRDNDVVNKVFKTETTSTWENSESVVGFVKSSNDNTITTSLSNEDFNQQSLLYKTQQLFKGGKIKTLIDSIGGYDENGDLVSKGNALLKKNSLNEFTRVWTAKNQYGNLSSLIRNFDEENTNTLEKNLKRVRPGFNALKSHGVLDDNGFVKIAPYFKDDFSANKNSDIKKYMFSIENLAWKDSIDSLIKGTSQEGPNNGRIMWFPPYNINISENTSVSWNDDSFIGRGEAVHTYVNTSRSGTLNFDLIVDHPSIINYMKQSDPSKIEENDYLRFFAGDDVVDLEYRAEENNQTTQPTPKVEQPEPVKSNTYTFKVYFPNYYSGINDGFSTAMTYLYQGKDCDESPNILNGYEMNLNDEGEGLSSFMGSACYGNYHHKVDNAYKQTKQSMNSNYKDTNSYNLNASEGVYDFSFKDVYEFLRFGSNVKNIREIFKTITKIEVDGSASHQGSDSVNVTISKNRAEIVKAWLTDGVGGKGFTNLKPENISAKSIYKSGKDNTNDVNNQDIKKERVVIIRMTDDVNTEFNAPDNYKYVTTGQTTTNVPKPDTVVKPKRTKVDMYGFSAKKPADGSNSQLWNDESQFFEKVQENSILMSKLSEKIKFFQPAFHSTTPEGFNSRLTFLHQCTRQGPTLNFNGSATNMSFGRPPICVLRVGDFYNTKIAIQNLTINYEPLVWDLNQEGIGVQPMIAKVTMQFYFIGGSDLTGPIARLQNAVSFNFFANTGVYDDRNDRKYEPKDPANPTPEEKNANVLYQPFIYDDKK